MMKDSDSNLNENQIERETQIKDGIWRPRIFDQFPEVDCAVATKQFGPGWIYLRESKRFEAPMNPEKFRLAKVLINFARNIAPNLDPHEIVYPELAHTDNIVLVDDEIIENYAKSKQRILQTDGVITKRPNTMLMVLTADCPSIGIYDPRVKAMGVFHSGWRGTSFNIVGEGIAKMVKEFGSKPENLVAAVGPGFSKNYEVKNDVLEAFRDSGQFSEEELNRLFTKVDEEHYHLDLFLAIKLQLQKAGVPENQMEITNLRTDLDNDLFPSYRLEGQASDRAPFVMYLKPKGN
jgi:hypothetical protein